MIYRIVFWGKQRRQPRRFEQQDTSIDWQQFCWGRYRSLTGRFSVDAICNPGHVCPFLQMSTTNGHILTFIAWIIGLALFAVKCDGADGSGGGDMATIQAWNDLAGTVDGDTYTIDPGTYSWGDASDFLEITKGVTIKGSGQGVTIIEDDRTGSQQQTVLFRLVSGQVSRLSDLTMRRGARDTGIAVPNGAIEVWGVPAEDPNTSTARFAIERIHFDYTPTGDMICADYAAMGVIADCLVDDDNRLLHSRWNRYSDGTIDNGDYAFTIGPQFSSDKFVFVEDCTVDYTGFYNVGICDGWEGARQVIRHNTLINSGWSNHGAETGDGRSGSVLIVHDNDFSIAAGGSTTFAAGLYRGGTGLVYDNTYTGYTSTSFNLQAFRFIGPDLGGWGEADGTRSWDNNDGSNPYDSGTATAGSGNSLLVDSSKSWTTDQWVGYTLNRTAGTGLGDEMDLAIITANDATSLTLASGKFTGASAPDMIVDSGDSYEINLTLEVLDQPGVFGGTPYINTSTLVVRQGEAPGGWTQNDEPIYYWGNTYQPSGTPVTAAAGSLFTNIREGEHYYNSSSQADAETDGLVYTEYTYPHPIRSGDPYPPPSPGNLRVIVNTLRIGAP